MCEQKIRLYFLRKNLLGGKKTTKLHPLCSVGGQTGNLREFKCKTWISCLIFLLELAECWPLPDTRVPEKILLEGTANYRVSCKGFEAKICECPFSNN